MFVGVEAINKKNVEAILYTSKKYGDKKSQNLRSIRCNIREVMLMMV